MDGWRWGKGEERGANKREGVSSFSQRRRLQESAAPVQISKHREGAGGGSPEGERSRGKHPTAGRRKEGRRKRKRYSLARRPGGRAYFLLLSLRPVSQSVRAKRRYIPLRILQGVSQSIFSSSQRPSSSRSNIQPATNVRVHVSSFSTLDRFPSLSGLDSYSSSNVDSKRRRRDYCYVSSQIFNTSISILETIAKSRSRPAPFPPPLPPPCLGRFV